MLKLRPALLLVGLLAGCSMASSVDSRGSSSADEAPAPHAPGTLVVDLVDGTSLEEARAATGLDLRWATPHSDDEALAVVDVADLAEADARLVGNALVEVAEPSVSMAALSYPNDPLFEKQWNLSRVGSEVGWRAGGGQGVIVAVVDTGVGPVPDLDASRVLEGSSVVPGVQSSADDQGHGTHVAGTIAQSTNNGFGVAGVAPNAMILPIKALDSRGSGSSEGVAAAIDEAVDAGAQIINLSLGGGHAEVIDVAVRKAVAAGVLVVAAAGNSGGEGVGCPAHAPGAIAVSATGPSDALAPYSTWGDEVAMAAPGGDKRTPGGGVLQDTIKAGGDHQFAEHQGTSMATPHVAGALAVLIGAGATPEQAVRLMEQSAADLGAPGRDAKFGYGLLDLRAAVSALVVSRSGPRFAIAALAGLMFAGLARRQARLGWALLTGALGGGLFFLPLLPLPPSLVPGALARPLLDWPSALGFTALGSSPLWLSALPVGALVFALGPTRTLGPVVGAVATAVGVTLLSAGVAGGGSLSWIPDALTAPWLLINGVLALFFALATAGVQRVQARGEA